MKMIRISRCISQAFSGHREELPGCSPSVILVWDLAWGMTSEDVVGTFDF